MDRNETELHSHQRHSDSRIAVAFDGFHDHIWTWIQVCKYFLESSWSLLSNASNLKVHIMSDSAAIIILVQRPFSDNGATTHYFSPLGRVSC
jgi:hypothetical protein